MDEMNGADAGSADARLRQRLEANLALLVMMKAEVSAMRAALGQAGEQDAPEALAVTPGGEFEKQGFKDLRSHKFSDRTGNVRHDLSASK